MFNSILERGMCNGAKGQCHLYNKHRESVVNRNRKDLYTTFPSGRRDGWFDDSTITSERYLIAPQQIHNAITRQYWAEERMEKRQGFEQQAPNHGETNRMALDDYQDIRQSMSFAESVLSSSGSISGATSTASISSFESAVSSIFSALTTVAGNTNKYGIPFKTPTLQSNKSKGKNLKKTKALRLSSHVDRYAISTKDSDEDDICQDWDYSLDLTKDCQYQPIPPNSSQVLHLKTHAYMSDFYVNEFLMSFPQYPLPPELVAKTFTSISPAQDNVNTHDVSSPIRLAVDGSSFMELEFYGSLGLGTARTEVFQRGSSLANTNVKRGYLKDFLVMGNSCSGAPILVSSLKSKKGKPIVRIYATKPRCKTQESIIHSDKLGITKESYPLFTWAELRAGKGEFPSAETKYSLHTCTGRKNEFHKEPLFTAIHGCDGMMDINVFGRKEDNERNAVGEPFHCARVCVRMDSQTQKRKSEINYMISVVKGVEVAMILAMVAIIDELVEFSMRKKFAILAWKFPTNEQGSKTRKQAKSCHP